MGCLAIDIGATYIRVAWGDETGLISKISETTDRNHGPMGITRQIVRMARDQNLGELKAIGVGSIGPIDLAKGCIVNTPNIPFKEIPVIDPLRKAFEVPVEMLNDCSAAVLGEHRYGAGIFNKNIVYVTFSTGLGGGAMVDGHLLIGKDGNAVEIGHITIDQNSSLLCGCGSRGHWEAYASGSGIPNFVRENLGPNFTDSLILMMVEGERENITSKTLFRAAKKGDAIALRLVDRLGGINAIGLANAVNAFDPELVTIGGSIALNNPNLILEPILENIDKHIINRKPKIIITPLGGDVVLYGALAYAISLNN